MNTEFMTHCWMNSCWTSYECILENYKQYKTKELIPEIQVHKWLVVCDKNSVKCEENEIKINRNGNNNEMRGIKLKKVNDIRWLWYLFCIRGFFL